MAGNASIEACGNLFADPDRNASSNYGVGSDGRVGLYVDEANRSWCTSSGSNDNRAVTIEVANDGDAKTGWHVSDRHIPHSLIFWWTSASATALKSCYGKRTSP